MQEASAHTNISRETWDQFKADRRPGPIQLLNLVRFRKTAEYSDGRSSSGADAYRRYSDMSSPVFRQLGGKIIWRGAYELGMIGPQNEIWDIAFIAEYPDVDAFLDMLKSPVYREALSHRQAGVLDSRLMRFRPEEPGRAFAA